MCAENLGSMRIIHKALGISLLVHLAIIISVAAVSFIAPKKHYTPVYQVSLVAQPEPKPKKPKVQPQEKKSQEKKLPVKKATAVKEPTPVKEPIPVKEPAPVKKATPLKKTTPVEKKAAPAKKTEKKKKATKKDTKKEQSLARVQRAIDEIKKKMAVQESIDQEHLRSSRIGEAKRNAYFDAIAAQIRANWSLLKNQMEDVGILTTDVGLQIRRDGTIIKIVIEKPSGNPLFDEFAVRAVKRSTPLPPFPKEINESKLEVTIGLSS